MRRYGRACLFAGTIAALGVALVAGQQAPPTPSPEDYQKRSRDFSAGMEKKGLAEPFRGITANGTVAPNLFQLRATGVSTAPVRTAAAAFLKSLDEAQRRKALFKENDVEWRKWANQHVYFRDGVSFQEMTGPQREAAFKMLRHHSAPRA